MILFQAQIEEHQSLAQHYRELAAKREALAAELLAVQEQADASLTALKSLLEKCRDASPNAIASLKSAVVGLFSDDGNDSGGNLPDSPKPPSDDDDGEPDLLAFNGITGDYLLSSDEPEKDDPVCPEGEHTLENNALLVGKVCPLDTGLYWANSTPDGSSWEFASPICCLLEDCPESSLKGQCYELCSLLEDKPAPFVELVIHPDNPNVAHIRKTADGQILTAYFGFRTKAIAQSWKEFIEAIAHRIEYRKAKQVPGVTWEIK
ncbi:MAG: hypothetical protein LDL41_05730, partial [Coleofasciculus sp. S288]|nr:hypothetical protein [Coleofasciculus sp. S288]